MPGIVATADFLSTHASRLIGPAQVLRGSGGVGCFALKCIELGRQSIAG